MKAISKLPLPTTHTLTHSLTPILKNIKSHAEKKLQFNTDYVLYNSNTTSGITDLSFEKHIDQKRVSVYFNTTTEGIEAYRNTVKQLTNMNVNIQNLELKFTPQFGQTRISFEWNHFFEFFNKSSQEKFLNSFITNNHKLLSNK